MLEASIVEEVANNFIDTFIDVEAMQYALANVNYSDANVVEEWLGNL